MFKKWFGKKKNDDQFIERDEWLQRDYILVPNETTPDDLTEYQKLIVLRKPEGEKRCVVDYSLSFNDVDRLQQDSIIGEADLFDENLKRVIPTYLNTKKNDFDLDNLDENELSEMSLTLKETFNELKLTEADFQEVSIREYKKDIPILKTDNLIGKVLKDKMTIFQYEQEKRKQAIQRDQNKVPDVDDIDGVDILTDFDLEIRDTWKDVDAYFEREESIEKRLRITDEDATLSPFYVPKIQPLFRNFIDVNFSEMKQASSLTSIYETAQEWYEDKAGMYTDEITSDGEEQFIDLNKRVSEDPEIVMNDIFGEQESEVIEQPKTLSFFKNEVTANRGYHSPAEHDPKYVQFYKSNRNFVYEKVILDKKRGIFNIRKKTPA